MGVPNDTTIAAGVRRWIDTVAQGTREDREELLGWIEEANRSGFPALLGVLALAELPARTLWKTFDDLELQDLYDLAAEAGLTDAAERLVGCRARAALHRLREDPETVREAVLERDGRCFQKCGDTYDLTIDHKIVPWSEGGSSTDPENLQVLCRSCNSRKGTRPWIPPQETLA